MYFTGADGYQNVLFFASMLSSLALDNWIPNEIKLKSN